MTPSKSKKKLTKVKKKITQTTPDTEAMPVVKPYKLSVWDKYKYRRIRLDGGTIECDTEPHCNAIIKEMQRKGYTIPTKG